MLAGFTAPGKFLDHNSYMNYDSFFPHRTLSSFIQLFDAIQLVTDRVVN